MHIITKQEPDAPKMFYTIGTEQEEKEGFNGTEFWGTDAKRAHQFQTVQEIEAAMSDVLYFNDSPLARIDVEEIPA